ncbi:nickel-dependent hydrogenase large subunit [Marinobacterium sp. AK62]|uniref:Nickel-dependent hydrogenase large subunit n=1 Tax=Marinobacterium alkalitolerans TaxID=1542925 RepID=A0ABS3Z6T3_9GAMM|nr:nickel-dependent hydrogenase large subunit [Marinobacterium alkalitolerans]MBP0047420.1 nickel-dependent hydrogenase large subunit [Marinobacterium alkalitolerans]
MTSRRIRIDVPALTRVEGEGSLRLEVRDGQLIDLGLSIFEPPRYFEKFLEGRDASEVVDIVARICGICPVAYQISALNALESLAGEPLTDWARSMRRVFYCGEWLQSHALHIHLLALPDFLGFDDAVSMAARHPDAVKRGLRLQGLGNALIKLFGGRSVHPVGARLGGFHHAPSPDDVTAIVEKLKAAQPEARDLTHFCAGLSLPDDPQSFICVALHHPDGYAMESGDIRTSEGLTLKAHQFEQHFHEHHKPDSTALWSDLDGQPYLTGPLARLNLNHAQLPAFLQQRLNEIGLSLPSHNMFHSLLARAIEIEWVLHEAIERLSKYLLPPSAHTPLTLTEGVGYGMSEAPRGLLWHRYALGQDGLIKAARIVPPTSQNQARIEADLHRSLTAFGLDQDAEALRLRAEQVIRNYDPCISCATHFLTLEKHER